jgi:hypothetical protein
VAELRNRGRTPASQIKREGREDLSESFPKVLRLPDVDLGGRERRVSGALLDA